MSKTVYEINMLNDIGTSSKFNCNGNFILLTYFRNL